MKNQLSTDKTEMTVTLPDGKVQVFRLSDGDRVYLKGSTLYWSLEQWEAAKTKMLAAGAQINEKGLK